jgi:hypothetical protein
MRQFRFGLLLAFALLASSEKAPAQTGEFAATVPGSVVHAGYDLQNWLQDMRNGRYEPAPVAAVPDPVIIVPPPREPAPVKPRKTAKKLTPTAQAQKQ